MSAREINFRFVPQGSVAQSVPRCEYWLDVGNIDAPRVFDHHFPGSTALSTTSMVYRALEDDRCDFRGCDSLSIVTHVNPDLDAIASTWMLSRAAARKYLSRDFLYRLANYVDSIDQGHTALTSSKEVSLYAMVNLAAWSENDDSPTSPSAARLVAMHRILDALESSEHIGFADVPKHCVPSTDMWHSVHQKLGADFRRYQEDLANAEIGELNIPRADGEGTARVKFLAADQPQSRLFKSWARGDSNLKPGPMLLIRISPSRAIFSVAPESGTNLRGLGDLLQSREVMPDVPPLEERENRPGYDVPDPWYDGRGTKHNFTIIDSPRAGTSLSWEDLKNAAYDYSESL